MENQGQYDFDPERFDFCIHRRKRKSAKQDVTPEAPKKIKTLLPKTKTLSTPESTLLTTATSSIESPSVSTPTTSTDGGEIFAIYYIFKSYHILIFAICLLHFTNSEMIYCKYL